MKRGGPAVPVQDGAVGVTALERGGAGWPQDRDIQALLQLDVTSRTDPVEEVEVGGAAAQKDVLAVVHCQPVVRKRPSKPPETGPLFEQSDVRAGVGTRERSRNTGQAASDHDQTGRIASAHAAALASAMAATAAFWPEDRLTLPCNTLSGFMRMRSSRRR